MLRRAAIALLIVGIAGAITAAILLRRREIELLEVVPAWGGAGWLACLGVYLLIAILGMPVSWFTAIVGYWYGPWMALLLATLGTNFGANLVFLGSRVLFRPRVAAWIAPKPRVAAIARAVGREGFRMTLLLRLSPISPFGFTTYALSVMGLRQRDFAAGTLLGKTPGNLFYGFLGVGARSAVEAASGEASLGAADGLLLGAGIAATGVLVWLLARLSKRALAEAGISGP